MFMSTRLDLASYAQNFSKAQNSIAQNASRMVNRWTTRHTLQMENLHDAMIALSTSPADMPKVWKQIWDDACDCAAEDLRDQLEFTSAAVRQMGNASVMRPLLEKVSEQELSPTKGTAKSESPRRKETRQAAAE